MTPRERDLKEELDKVRKENVKLIESLLSAIQASISLKHKINEGCNCDER